MTLHTRIPRVQEEECVLTVVLASADDYGTDRLIGCGWASSPSPSSLMRTARVPARLPPDQGASQSGLIDNSASQGSTQPRTAASRGSTFVRDYVITVYVIGGGSRLRHTVGPRAETA